ncbi:unnamed protein product [Heligmosomoides polygyrus]|uniref:Lipase_3 domain-containing protein n=1 Tax=Heligmosomoides polygyrus TaxID=6339 RepID=A0A183FNK0_HELPZ|nr:unnamed protein product [Heligmosomoides polygyrus]
MAQFLEGRTLWLEEREDVEGVRGENFSALKRKKVEWYHFVLQWRNVQEGTRKVVSPAAVPLVKRGIALAAIGYEYASGRKGVLFVQLLLDRYPQVKAMTLAGHSAGAQLAFKVFTRLRSPRIQKLAFFAGAFDLKELPRCEIGTLIGLSPEEAEVNSCSALELAGADVRVLIMVALKAGYSSNDKSSIILLTPIYVAVMNFYGGPKKAFRVSYN